MVQGTSTLSIINLVSQFTVSQKINVSVVRMLSSQPGSKTMQMRCRWSVILTIRGTASGLRNLLISTIWKWIMYTAGKTKLNLILSNKSSPNLKNGCKIISTFSSTISNARLLIIVWMLSLRNKYYTHDRIDGEEINIIEIIQEHSHQPGGRSEIWVHWRHYECRRYAEYGLF